MQVNLGIYLRNTLIKSHYSFDYDWLRQFLDSHFDGLFWMDSEDCIEGYLWGILRFWIQIAPKEVIIPKKQGIGRPEGTGKVDRIIAEMKKDIKNMIKNDELSVSQVSEMFTVSFPTAQKIVARLKA